MTSNEWSVPESEVLASIREILDEGRDAVLATVIGVEGSAYRRPGAKMIVDDETGALGSITAGCLEDEVFELASEVLADGSPRVETYDLMEDEDDVWGLGVGCNGIIDILLEPLDASYEPAIEAIEANERIGVITVVDGDEATTGSRAYYRPGEGLTVETGTFPNWLLDALADPAATLVEDGGSDTIRIETEAGSAEVFIDGLEPAPELVVLGTGHDVGPVVELGAKNDFRTTVIGFRGAADLEDRFPHADAIKRTSPANLADIHDFGPDTYVVVMTHNFIDDRLAIDALVDTDVAYIGLMGPHDRFEEMLEDFAEEGRTFTEDELDRIYTPIGIDLGGGSPYQIATSIVAEVLAVANDRTPKHLRVREGPIHDRVTVEAANPEVSD
ncbi:MAG: XdhC family protein [Halobacteriales archaeon]